MQLAGKTALITGSGGALGSAMVQMLLDFGASVIALDIAPSALTHPKLTALTCDVSDAGAVEKALLPVLEKHNIDILINNAGILHSAPLVNMLNKDANRFAQAAADWQRVINVNLSSAFYVTQLVASHMLGKRTKGVIINMSSVSARGTAGQSAYAASKAGMEALTQVWAKELGPMSVRCVAIAPGYIDTPSTHKAITEAQLQSIKDRVPLKNLGAPENILQAVRYAIENDYVNATTLEVDGGLVV